MGVTPYQHREMLESDTNFAWIFDDMPISWGHKVDEWRGRWGCNGIGRIDDRYRRTAQRRRADDFAVDPQGTGTEAVFAIEPFQDLVDEAGGEWELIKRPPFDPKVHLQRRWIAQAADRIEQSRPNKGLGCSSGAELRQQGTGYDIQRGQRQLRDGNESIPERTAARRKRERCRQYDETTQAAGIEGCENGGKRAAKRVPD